MTEFEIINDILLESPHEHEFETVERLSSMNSGHSKLGYCKECRTFRTEDRVHYLEPIIIKIIEKGDEDYKSYEKLKKRLDNKQNL